MLDKEFPPSPFAKYSGILGLSNAKVNCYVLDTEERVITLGATVKAIAKRDHSKLGEYIGVKALKSYINSKLILGEVIVFNIPGTQLKGKGLSAETFLDICTAYVDTFAANNLETDRQKEIAIQCSMLLASCAKIGLIALIDEATGYQHDRKPDALTIKMQAFFSPELREWEKTFPDELWEEFGRLTNWHGALHHRPKWWGKLVIELIYESLDHDVAEHLKNNKPPPKHGLNYHQWLSSDFGLNALVIQINQVIGIAKTCDNIHELREKVKHYYQGGAFQQKLFKKDISRKNT